jgi:deoxycytidylate deaminase/dephospho-CoA kinase
VSGLSASIGASPEAGSVSSASNVTAKLITIAQREHVELSKNYWSIMDNYLHSAIDTIYRKDDELIILGLTGRTGSGCSTVAKILCSAKNDIRHSLLEPSATTSNDARKRRIVAHHFDTTWRPFQLIQVRSVITLLLVEQPIRGVRKSLERMLSGETVDIKRLIAKLKMLKTRHDYCVQSNQAELKINFLTCELPSLCEEVRKILGESAFVKLYQEIGTNIRMSGSPVEQQFAEGKFFTLAERINLIIKQIVKANKDLHQSTLIVIDAIRSPLEAMFFQDRHASFYLAAVSCSEEDRRRRLHRLDFSDSDVERIDAEEYDTRDLDEASTYSVQDIKACIQRADIYISNPNENHVVSQFKYLSNQLIRFTSLMKRPGIVTPTPIERCMQLAYTAKLNSGCISRQVGAAITNSKYAVMAVGWNDVPAGQVPCVLRNREDLINGSDQAAYSEYEKGDAKFVAAFKASSLKYIPIKKSGRNLSYCFKSEYNALTGEKNQVHTRSLHAEENAFLQLSKYGSQGIFGGVLFTTASPCELCSKKAYQLGISKIYYIDPYPGIAVRHVLMGGANPPKLLLFYGAIGRAFHKLYNPILPYKDELTTLIPPLEPVAVT